MIPPFFDNKIIQIIKKVENPESFLLKIVMRIF